MRYYHIYIEHKTDRSEIKLDLSQKTLEERIIGVLRPFGDIAGFHIVRLDNSPQRRQELAQCLEAAGCPVNLEGTDWHTVGDFEPSS